MKKRLAVPLTAMLAWSGSVVAQQPAAPAKPYQPDNKPVRISVPGSMPSTVYSTADAGRAGVSVPAVTPPDRYVSPPARPAAPSVRTQPAPSRQPSLSRSTVRVSAADPAGQAVPLTPLRPGVPETPKPLPPAVATDPAKPPTPPAQPKPATPTPPAQAPQTTSGPIGLGDQPRNAAEAEAQKKMRLMDTHCGPPEQVWAKTGYLFMQFKDMTIPFPLVTTGPLVNVGPPNFVAVGNPQTVAGADDIGFGTFNGMTVSAGGWFDSRHTLGVEFAGFILESRSEIDGINSDGTVAIARPIIDSLATPAAPFDVLVAIPGFTRGGVTASAETQLASAEANLVRNLTYCESYTWDVIAGFRYLDLDESLTVSQYTEGLPVPNVMNGDSRQTVARLNGVNVVDLTVQDRFRSRNQFFGGQVGTRFEVRRGIWFGGFSGKVGLGPNHQVVEINGWTSGTAGPNQAATAGQQISAPGGVLAVRGNSQDANGFESSFGNTGRYTTNWFVIVPEVGLSVGCQVTKNIRTTLGYNFLYMNSVTRPGDVISQTVNQKFIPSSSAFGSQSGANQPVPQFDRSSFFAHGVELGLQLQF